MVFAKAFHLKLFIDIATCAQDAVNLVARFDDLHGDAVCAVHNAVYAVVNRDPVALMSAIQDVATMAGHFAADTASDATKQEFAQFQADLQAVLADLTK